MIRSIYLKIIIYIPVFIILYIIFLYYFRNENIKKTHSMWLLAPLISKLPSAVQGRVLKVAGKNNF